MSYILQKKVRLRLKRLVFALLGIYILIGTMLYFLQEQILFRPTKLSQDYTFVFNYPFEELFFKTEDNATINAIHFKAENPEGVILYFHGNAGDLSRWGKVTEYFVEKQYDVLVMDYRNYGKSEGEYDEQLMYDDAQLCYDYLLKQYSEKDISVYGRSLGGSFATYVTAKNNPKQLILETPFYNVQDVAKHRFPFLPTNGLLKYRFLNNKYIKEVKCPVYIIHGTDDYVVPFSSGEKLFQTVLKPQAKFTIIEGGNHNNLIEFESYHKLINKVFP